LIFALNKLKLRHVSTSGLSDLLIYTVLQKNTPLIFDQNFGKLEKHGKA